MADAGRAMMLYRGMYDSTYTYEKLDVVNHNGSLYISTTDGNLGTEPTEETKWKLFLQGGIADNIQATDTHGLVGEAGENSFVQLLLDSLASRIQGVTLNRQTLGYSKKNLLKNTATSTTENGVTFTVNDDGSVTLNGTATANPTFTIGKFTPVPNKAYIFTANSEVPGDNSSLGNNYCFIYNIDGVPAWKSDVFASDGTHVPYEFTPTTDNEITCQIYVAKGTTVENLTFYPMLRSADITDDTYEPYVDDVDTRLKDVETELGEIPNTYIPKKSILNSQEEIDANTSEGNIAGALAVKEISKKMQNEMEASSNWVDITDLCDFGFVDIAFAGVYINFTLRLVSFWVAVNGNVNNQGTLFVVASLPSGSNPKILISSCDHTTDGVSVNLLTDGGTVKSSHSMDVSIANARYSGLIAF